MKIQLTVDCSDLDDLKSAKTCIDRMIAEHPNNVKIASGMVNIAHIPPISTLGPVKIDPTPVVHFAPYGPNKRNQFYCGAKTDEGYTTYSDGVTCQKCKDLHPGIWPKEVKVDPAKKYEPSVTVTCEVTGDTFDLKPLKKPLDMSAEVNKILVESAKHMEKVIADGAECIKRFNEALSKSSQPKSLAQPVERTSYPCECGLVYTREGMLTQGKKCSCGRVIPWWECHNCKRVWLKANVLVKETGVYLCPCSGFEIADSESVERRNAYIPCEGCGKHPNVCDC